MVSKPRILAGSAKGRTIDTPSRGTRPSPARLREAIFDALQGREGERFVDLYAGSGAVGLEAASRGYTTTLVEARSGAAAVVRRNARRLNLDVEIVQGDAIRTLEGRRGSFDVAFVDPPYDADLGRIFAQVVAARPVDRGGRYLFQHPVALAPRPEVEAALRDIGESSARIDERRYGSNAVLIVDVAGP